MKEFKEKDIKKVLKAIEKENINNKLIFISATFSLLFHLQSFFYNKNQ